MLRTIMSLCFALVIVGATAPGAQVSVSQSALDYIKGPLSDAIKDTLEDLNVPEVKKDVGGFEVHVFDIKTDSLDWGGLDLSFDSGKGLKLSLKLSWGIHTHFDAKEDGWPHLSTAGDADIKAKKASISATMVIGESGGKPTVSASDSKIDLGDFDIDFKDGIIGDLANVLEGFFKDKIKDAIESAGESALKNVVASLDKQLHSINLAIPLASWGAEVNLALTAAPAVTSSYLGLSMVGATENTKSPVTPPASVPKPALPGFSGASSHYLSFDISPWLFNTMEWVYQQHGDMQRTVPHTDIPAGFPVQLNTTDLSVFAPGLSKAYPRLWCQLLLQSVNTSTLTASSANGVVVNAPVSISVQPITASGPVTAFAIGCDIQGAVDFQVLHSQTLTANVSSISCNLEPLSSKVGPVKVGGLSALIDFVLDDVALPALNSILNKGFPLPSMDGLTLTKSEVAVKDGAVVIASDFTWKPPSTRKAASAA